MRRHTGVGRVVGGLAVALVASVVITSAGGAPRAALGARTPDLPGPTWRVGGPDGGQPGAFGFGPGGRVFAGTGGAGVFSSDDGGRTWVRRSSGMPPDTGISHIEAYPSTPVVYAASGDHGLFRSADNGDTWTRITQIASVEDVAFHPSQPDTVIMVAGSVYRSTDAGAHWETLHNPNGTDLHGDGVAWTSDPDVIYLSDVYVRRSDDGGDSWGGTGFSQGIVEDLAVDPTDPARAYVTTLWDGVFRTQDSGATWSPAQSGLTGTGFAGLAVDPADPASVWVGSYQDGGVFRSDDFGRTWTARTIGSANAAARFVAVQPGSRRVWVGVSSRGPYVTSDGGSTWSLRRHGFIGSGVQSLLVMPGAPRVVLAGTYGDGVHRSADRGASFHASTLRDVEVWGLAAPRRSTRVAVAGTPRGIYRTADAGRSWTRESRYPAEDVEFSLSSPQVVYACSQEAGLLRSTDGGRTWTKRSDLGGYGADALAIHPNDPATIWVADQHGVSWSHDGGRTYHFPGSGTVPEMVHELVVPPGHPRTVYAASDYGLEKSTDSGHRGSWRHITPDLAGNSDGYAVVLQPERPSTVYYGALNQSGWPGVYRSRDGGDTWVRWVDGMHTTWIESLAVSPDGSRLYAGTTAYGLESGGGVLRARLP